MKTGVPYRRLGSLRKALAEAARTDESNADQAIARFVELRPGLKDTLCARRHHLLAGRRGTGKSTLLHVVREQLRREGAPFAVIDMERFKGRPFPDVLIEILIALLDEVKPRVRVRSAIRDLRLRRQFRTTRRELEILLRDPQSLSKHVERSEKASRRTSSGAAMSVNLRHANAGGSAAAAAQRSRSSDAAMRASAEFEELKIERLQQLASRLAEELTKLVRGASTERAIIFIDDFSYVQLDDQADVLDYLHQVVKNTGIWLKVGGVGTRMRPFRDADPPVGMQLNQDIDPLTIDVTLSDFSTAQRFLERMMDGILQPIELSTAQVFTDSARTRMVLACGGAVARDYVTLTGSAIDAAVERLSKQNAPTPDTLVTIQAEDVNLAARQRLNKKEDEELDQDAGSDAQRLKGRWRDICAFVREQGNSAFVLFRQQDLDGAAWGNEVRQLENLRLLHRIRDAVPNTPNWRGVKVVVYMVDLGQVAVQRLRTGIPPFWQGSAEFDKLRRAEWVYAPEWEAKLAEKKSKRPPEAAPAPGHEAEPQPLVLFEHPVDLDG
jgi:Cdc6-like AAA superfamily ATPase